MAQPKSLLLFGDQTVDVASSLRELVSHRQRSRLLDLFFKDVDKLLRQELPKLALNEQEWFSSSSSALQISEGRSDRDSVKAADHTFMTSIMQLGNLVLLVEADPSILYSGESCLIVAICTGALAGLAALLARSISDLLEIIPMVAATAFRLGCVAQRRADSIERSTGNWAQTLFSVTEESLESLINDFNEEKMLSVDNRLYISSLSKTSPTISGPPSSLKLFSESYIPPSAKLAELPLKAPYHAPHLRMTKCESEYILEPFSQMPLRDMTQRMVSAATGRFYSCSTPQSILSEIITEILCCPLDWNALLSRLSSELSGSDTQLVPIGPCNCANYLTRELGSAGIELKAHTKSNTPPMANHQNKFEDIAIIGMAGRFPGGDTLEMFWKVLESGLDLHRKIPEDRFDVNTHFDPSGKIKNTSLTPYGVFIDSPGLFDARMFNMSPREAAQTDPMQRLLLLTTYEALEMAGYSPNRTPSSSASRIGSYFGQTSDDWREVNASQNIDTFFITGGIRAFGPGRLNYYFKWEGPSYSVDTACSSSAASIQLAVTALRSGEIDMAVAGGANILTASDLFAGLSRGGFLSPTGSCKTFDDSADGYCRGDAVGTVILKRLSDAVADNDNILTVIKGISTNHSANAISITHPHSETQQKLFRKVVHESGLTPVEVDAVELHGTGTQAGDFTEFSSVTSVFAQGRSMDDPLYISTVKPNLGHGEAASGVTSLIKAIMMLRANAIPPHVGIKDRMNSKVTKLESLPVRLATSRVGWPRKERKRRILINNFDAAGGNTSMVIEDPTILDRVGSDPRTHHVVAISGRTMPSYLQNRQRLLRFIKENNLSLADLAYTTTARRQHHIFRSAYGVEDIESLVSSLEKEIKQATEPERISKRRVIFAFTGQGSHFPEMGRQLYQTNKLCRSWFEEYDAICIRQGLPSFLGFITGEMPDIENVSAIQLQLAIVSIELVHTRLWQSFGVLPDAVIGHSLGEYPALVVAGVISPSDMLYLVGKRAMMIEEECTAGTHTMVAIKATATEILPVRRRSSAMSCEIACINSPDSTVVGGTTADVASLRQELDRVGIKATPVNVQYAYHSEQVIPAIRSYSAIASTAKFAAPKIPVASPLEGIVIREPIINAEYLTRQARECVDFVQAVKALQEDEEFGETSMWVDMGAKPFCLGMVKSSLDIPESQLIHSSKQHEASWKSIAQGLAKLYNGGVDIQWNQYHREYELSLRLLDLPRYAFDLKNYWLQYEGDWSITKGHSRALGGSKKQEFQLHTSSMHGIESESMNGESIKVVFSSNIASPLLNAAIKGHQVNNAGLCPSSLYADMALTAASYVHSRLKPDTQCPAMDVQNMEVSRPLIADPAKAEQWIKVTATTRNSSDLVRVTYSSVQEDKLVEHAHCLVAYAEPNKWLTEWSRQAYLIDGRIERLKQGVEDGHVHKILKRMVYKLFSVLVTYSDPYQGLSKVYLDSEMFEAAGYVKFQTTASNGQFFFSPYWIDSLLHISGFVLNGSDATPEDAVYISHGWKSLRLPKQLVEGQTYRSYVRMQPEGVGHVMAGDVYILEGDRIVGLCIGLKFQQVKRSILSLLLPASQSRVKQQRRELHPVENSVVKVQVSTQEELPNLSNLFEKVLSVIALEAEVPLSDLVDSAHLTELGVDSLLTIGILDKLRDVTKKDIPSSLFISHPTIAELRTFFLDGSRDFSSDEESSSSQASFASKDSDSRRSIASTNSSIESAVEVQYSGKEPFSTVLRKVIADELGVSESEIQPSTVFTDIGLDSLLSLVVTNAIKDITGRELEGGFFLQNTTFGHILKLEGGPRPTANASIRTKRQSLDISVQLPDSTSTLLQGTRGPLGVFLLPDGSGLANSYLQLPDLNVDMPIIGLNSPFITNAEGFTCSIEHMASKFLSEIRSRQPQGPYILGGWSIGGTYAYEVARQVIASGDRVLGVLLIDAPCPTRLPPMSIETIDMLEKSGTFGKLRSDGRSSLPSSVRQHFLGSINALKAYKPKPLDAAGRQTPCCAIWARDGVFQNQPTSSSSSLIALPDDALADWLLRPRKEYGGMGWEALLPNIRCEVVDGNHFTIMKEPMVKTLSDRISEQIVRFRKS